MLLVLQDIFLRLLWRLRSGARISLLSVFCPLCRFGRKTFVERMCVLHAVNLGDYSYVGDGSRIINADIGKYCSISSSVQIGLGRHPTGFVSTSPVFFSNRNALKTRWVENPPEFEEYRKVTIGSDVWIGINALVRDGITIGDGAIIGAGAVVTKDVAPYSVVAGVPAREISKRFDGETIERLEELRWWEWPEEKIRENVGLFADTGSFLQKFQDSGRNK